MISKFEALTDMLYDKVEDWCIAEHTRICGKAPTKDELKTLMTEAYDKLLANFVALACYRTLE